VRQNGARRQAPEWLVLDHTLGRDGPLDDPLTHNRALDDALAGDRAFDDHPSTSAGPIERTTGNEQGHYDEHDHDENGESQHVHGVPARRAR